MNDVTSSPRPRVVLASCRVGAGHNQAARALLAGLHQADAAVDAEFVDVLGYVSWAFRAYYAGGYAMLVSRLPWLYGLGYRLTDRPQGPGRTLSERLRLWSDRRGVRRFLAWLDKQRPALAVNTHYLHAPGIGRMIGQGAQGLRQFVVVTDNELHRWWYAENVERYFVPNDEVRHELMGCGVDGGRIDVTGIPVHPKWLEPLDRRRILADWDLPADRPVVLISAGVHFTIGRMDKLAARLTRQAPDAFFLVLAGGNKKLIETVSALPEAQGPQPRVRAVSFTDRIHELVEVADLVVTKPGGMITSECLVKSAAMVLLKPVPGQESANADLLRREGAAVVAADAEQVVAHVSQLLAERGRADDMRAAARRLARPGANAAIVQRIIEAVHRGDF